jgi:hypothetical protein
MKISDDFDEEVGKCYHDELIEFAGSYMFKLHSEKRFQSKCHIQRANGTELSNKKKTLMSIQETRPRHQQTTQRKLPSTDNRHNRP